MCDHDVSIISKQWRKPDSVEPVLRKARKITLSEKREKNRQMKKKRMECVEENMMNRWKISDNERKEEEEEKKIK